MRFRCDAKGKGATGKESGGVFIGLRIFGKALDGGVDRTGEWI